MLQCRPLDACGRCTAPFNAAFGSRHQIAYPMGIAGFWWCQEKNLKRRNGLHESTTGKWQVAKPNRKESPRANCAANAGITRSPDGTVNRDRREPPNYL